MEEIAESWPRKIMEIVRHPRVCKNTMLSHILVLECPVTDDFTENVCNTGSTSTGASA